MPLTKEQTRARRRQQVDKQINQEIARVAEIKRLNEMKYQQGSGWKRSG